MSINMHGTQYELSQHNTITRRLGLIGYVINNQNTT